MYAKILAFTIVAAAVFLVSGGVSITSFLLNGYSYNDPNPRQTSAAPAAIGFVTLGAVGLGMVGLSAKNFRANEKLAKKQLWVGFSLVFTTWIALELLWKLTL